MHRDLSSSEIRIEWLTTAHDEHGNAINVGAAVTVDGKVVLIAPPGGTPVLNQYEAAEYLARVRAAFLEASTPTTD